VTALDIELARTITALATDAGLRPDASAVSRLEIALEFRRPHLPSSVRAGQRAAVTERGRRLGPTVHARADDSAPAMGSV
jgi:hypothetical protein